MKLKNKIALGSLYLTSYLLNKRIPIFVAWGITHRCNLRCLYCQSWMKDIPELDTSGALKIVRLLSKSGTKILRLTGGEPLLREDLAEIIKYSKRCGLFTTIATNGILVPEKIGKIREIDEINISLDGPEQVHDTIRGVGSHKKALEACKIINSNKIPITITCVLSSLNLDNIEYLLDLANNFRARIFFQPATEIVLFGNSENPVYAKIEECRNSIRKLMDLKRKNKCIANSKAGLRYMLRLPHRGTSDCMAGRFFFRIDPGGNIYRCDRNIGEDQRINVLENGMANSLKEFRPLNCYNCCASALIELNTLLSFNIINLIRHAFA